METTVIPPGTVVVGLDGSPSSEQALEWAIDHAGREHLQLTLAHGLDPAGSVWMEPEGADHRAVLGALQDDALAMLKRSRERVAEVAPYQTVHQALWMSDARVTLLDLASRQTQILTDSSKDESPSFAPNGRMVLYATEIGGRGVLAAV